MTTGFGGPLGDKTVQARFEHPLSRVQANRDACAYMVSSPRSPAAQSFFANKFPGILTAKQQKLATVPAKQLLRRPYAGAKRFDPLELVSSYKLKVRF